MERRNKLQANLATQCLRCDKCGPCEDIVKDILDLIHTVTPKVVYCRLERKCVKASKQTYFDNLIAINFYIERDVI